MKHSFSLLAAAVSTVAITLVACTGDQGPQGDPGPAATGGTGTLDPSVSAVTPTRAFLARKVDVTVSGNGTKWAEGTTVDFGKGITVDKIVVASPTALVASITVDATADIGARDVTVNAAGVASIYKGAFTLESPMEVEVKGTSAQGSIFFITLKNKDLTTPFDTTSESTGLFSSEFVGLTTPKISGVQIQVSNVTQFSADLVAFVDTTAAASSTPFTITSGVDAKTAIAFPYPKGIEIAARTAEPLTLGTAKAVDVAKAYDSQLFLVTPNAALGLTDITVTTSDQTFAPGALLLAKDGKFANALTTSFGGANTLITTTADPIYAIVSDTTGATGGYSIKAAHTTATAATEGANHASQANAQALATLPVIVTDAALSSGTEVDWYKITAVAGDVGKKIRVITAAGDEQTDTVVEIFGPGGAISDATDDNYHENVVSEAIDAAGTYAVKISYSTQSTWSATKSKYQLAIRLE